MNVLCITKSGKMARCTGISVQNCNEVYIIYNTHLMTMNFILDFDIGRLLMIVWCVIHITTVFVFSHCMRITFSFPIKQC